MPLLIVRNDITEMKVDAIVNTANPLPMVGSGVDKAIYKKAGWMELLKIRRQIGNLGVAQVAVTPGLNLNAKHIIHVVGPRWKGGENNEAEKLAACYKNILAAATEHECESVAIPLISTGNYDFPKDLALSIARKVISQYLQEAELLVYLVVFDKRSFQLSKELFENVQSYIDEKLVRETYKCMECGRKNFLNAPQKDDIRFNIEPLASYSKVLSSASKPKIKKRSLKDAVKNLDRNFTETLLDYIKDKNLTEPEVYKRANIDRKLFHKIKNKKDYHTSKNTALALAIALELNLDETKDFIGKAGFAINHCERFDVIVEYFIVEGIYDVRIINEALFEFDQPVLGFDVA